MAEKAEKAEKAQSGNEGRATRTRTAILDAAETLFAERGFAAARLEDVAEAVGIRRASIVYYFKDKREVYEAVLERVFSELQERITAVFASPDPLPERVEAGVIAWAEFVSMRPSFARLLMREIADGGPDSAARRYTFPFYEVIQKYVFDVQDDPSADQLESVDPVHMASTIAGASVFFVTAIPIIVPELGVDPSSPEQVAAHRAQALHIVRRLLGTSGSSGPEAKVEEYTSPPTGRPADPPRADGEGSEAEARRSPSSPAAKRSRRS